jgi:phosphoesterase RecJ-like protein
MSELQDVATARERVLERIRADRKFVLAAHENPDGDALGSLIGMHELLSAIGKESVMFIAADDLPLPPEYRMFDLRSAIQAPPADISERTVVFLDCGNIDRNSASKAAQRLEPRSTSTTTTTTPASARSTTSCLRVLDRRDRGPSDGLGVEPTPAAARRCTRPHHRHHRHVREHGVCGTAGGRADRRGVEVQRIYRALYEDIQAKVRWRSRSATRRFGDGELTSSLSLEDFESADAEEHDSRGSSTAARAARNEVAVLVRELIPASAGRATCCAPPTTTSTCRIARAQGGGGHRCAAFRRR